MVLVVLPLLRHIVQELARNVGHVVLVGINIIDYRVAVLILKLEHRGRSVMVMQNMGDDFQVTRVGFPYELQLLVLLPPVLLTLWDPIGYQSIVANLGEKTLGCL